MNASDKTYPVRRSMITLRTTDDEKNAIKARANAHGLSIGAFIREVTLDKPLPKANRFTQEQGQFVALVLSSLGTMMDHIRTLETQQHSQTIANALARELLRLRDLCFTALGRRP